MAPPRDIVSVAGGMCMTDGSERVELTLVPTVDPASLTSSLEASSFSYSLPTLPFSPLSPANVSRSLASLDGLNETRRGEVQDWLQAQGLTLAEMDLDTTRRMVGDLQRDRRWTLQDVQNLVQPEGMNVLYGHGRTLPFGFQNDAEFQEFGRRVMSELYTSGIPLFDEDGRPNPSIRVFIQGSAATGRDSREGLPFRWEAPVVETAGKTEASDVDIGIMMDADTFEHFVQRRIADNMSHADGRTSGDVALRWYQTVDQQGNVRLSKYARKFWRMMSEDSRLSAYHMDGQLQSSHNRLRDWLEGRNIQISLMVPDSPFVPSPDQQMILSAQEFLTPDPVTPPATINPDPVTLPTSAWNRFRADSFQDGDFREALRAADPTGRLARAYERISPAARPVTTVGDFLTAVRRIEPNLPSEIEATLARSGNAIGGSPWRALAEMVISLADGVEPTRNGRPFYTDASARSEAVNRFERRLEDKRNESEGRDAARSVDREERDRQEDVLRDGRR